MKEITIKRFNSEIRPQIKDEMKSGSIMETPVLQKIVINAGLGAAKQNKNLIKDGITAIESFTGQKTIPAIAKAAIVGFKLREELAIGARVTLRKGVMYDFLSRLVNIYIPRIRDFHGLSKKSFDGRGNYSLGINDMRIFPEVTGNSAETVPGITITFVTSAKNNDSGIILLRALGLPFTK